MKQAYLLEHIEVCIACSFSLSKDFTYLIKSEFAYCPVPPSTDFTTGFTGIQKLHYMTLQARNTINLLKKSPFEIYTLNI